MRKLLKEYGHVFLKAEWKVTLETLYTLYNPNRFGRYSNITKRPKYMLTRGRSEIDALKKNNSLFHFQATFRVGWGGEGHQSVSSIYHCVGFGLQSNFTEFLGLQTFSESLTLARMVAFSYRGNQQMGFFDKGQ